MIGRQSEPPPADTPPPTNPPTQPPNPAGPSTPTPPAGPGRAHPHAGTEHGAPRPPSGPPAKKNGRAGVRPRSIAASGIAAEVEGWLRDTTNPEPLLVIPGQTQKSPGRGHAQGS